MPSIPDTPSTALIPPTTAPLSAPPHISPRPTFLTLPPELRNQIYTLLLTPPHPLSPSLLLTCRLIHSEAAAILYHTHTFTAHPSFLLARLCPHTSHLHRLPPHHDPDNSTHRYPRPSRNIVPALVRNPPAHFVAPAYAPLISRFHLRVRLDVDPYYTPAQVEKAFTGAEALELEVWQGSFRGAGEGVLRVFEGVRGVREMKVEGSVGRGYAAWLEGVMGLGVGVVVVGGWDEDWMGRS